MTEKIALTSLPVTDGVLLVNVRNGRAGERDWNVLKVNTNTIRMKHLLIVMVNFEVVIDYL